MIDQETRDQLENLKPDTLDVEDAFEVAIAVLIGVGDTRTMAAAVTLVAIYDQQGCEGWDCGRREGSLLGAISVAVFG